MRVVAASVWICYLLKKIHVHTDSESVVKGALCHDLGILDRDEKFDNNKECYREHPVESVEVAKKLLPDLSEKSVEIIRTHMWPVTSGASYLPGGRHRLPGGQGSCCSGLPQLWRKPFHRRGKLFRTSTAGNGEPESVFRIMR